MQIMIPAWVNETLTPVEKLEVHQRGLRHKAVSVFVLKGQKVLLQRRALEKYHTPGLWANACCTHPSWGEASEVCAIRRIDEEMGLKSIQPEFRATLEYRADVGGGLIEHEVVDVFVAIATESQQVVPDPDEVMDFQWVDYQNLHEQVTQNPARFTPWLRIYMAEHADTIFGPDFGS